MLIAFSNKKPISINGDKFEFNKLAKNHDYENFNHPVLGNVLVYKDKDFISYFDYDGNLMMLYFCKKTYEKTLGQEVRKIVEKSLFFPSGENLKVEYVFLDERPSMKSQFYRDEKLNEQFYVAIHHKSNWMEMKSSDCVKELNNKFSMFSNDLGMNLELKLNFSFEPYSDLELVS